MGRGLGATQRCAEHAVEDAPGERLTTRELAAALGIGTRYARTLANSLARRGRVVVTRSPDGLVVTLPQVEPWLADVRRLNAELRPLLAEVPDT